MKYLLLLLIFSCFLNSCEKVNESNATKYCKKHRGACS